MSLENSPDFFLNFSVCEMRDNEQPFYQFKSFQLDVAERQLLNNGVAVPLAPKAFDVLVALVERNGHLVEKDELLRLVWSDSFVEEANVSRIVHTLRKVLGEDENGNKFIETLPKKGYRFVAEVKKVSQSPSQNDHQNLEIGAEIPPENPFIPYEIQIDKNDVSLTHEPKRRGRTNLIIAGFLSAILLASLLAFNRQPKALINSNEVKSIAVLPLKPINTETRDLIYELGIAESLIFKLSSAKGLKVRPLSARAEKSGGDFEQKSYQ